MFSNIKLIDNTFEEFVKKHALLNQYVSEDYNGQSNNLLYPILWVDWTQRKTSVKSGSMNPTVPVYVMVMPDKDGSVMAGAEAEQYAYDFLTTFADNRRKYGFWCNIESTMVPVGNFGTGADGAQGVRFEMQISFAAGQNQNIIPTE